MVLDFSTEHYRQERLSYLKPQCSALAEGVTYRFRAVVQARVTNHDLRISNCD